MIGALKPEDVVVAFQDFMVHVLTQAQRDRPTREEKPWKFEKGYIKWFYHVSHPMFSDHVPVAMYTAHVSLTRRLLLNSSGPDLFSTHSKLLRTSEPKWIIMEHLDVFPSSVLTGIL